MATAVLLPKQGNSVESCIINAWMKKEGDAIKVGDVLCEVQTDKAAVEVEAQVAGVLLKIFRPVGDDVPVQTAIAAIGNAGEDVSALAPAGVAPISSDRPIVPMHPQMRVPARVPAHWPNRRASMSPPSPAPAPTAWSSNATCARPRPAVRALADG